MNPGPDRCCPSRFDVQEQCGHRLLGDLPSADTLDVGEAGVDNQASEEDVTL